MTSYAAMGSALYGRLGTAQYTIPTSGTAGTVGVLGVYDSEAWQGSATPYVIYALQDAIDTYTFGTVSGESADYFVQVVSNRRTAHEAQVLYDQVHVQLQDAPLSIAGGYPLRVRRTSRRQYKDSTNYWHVGGIYRIDSWNS